jgi:hypothetical protein
MATLPKLKKELGRERVVQSGHGPGVSAAELEGIRWKKSSFSTGGECVALAEVGGDVVLLNSNVPERGKLLFSRAAVADLIAGCKSGELDDLTTA